MGKTIEQLKADVEDARGGMNPDDIYYAAFELGYAMAKQEKPSPEIIYGDGATILRPGVWTYRDHERTTGRWLAACIVMDNSDGTTHIGREYIRIGDVPIPAPQISLGKNEG